MGKITDIQPQKRNRSRVSVFVDGEFVCGLDAVTAAAARIKIGDEIDETELKKIVMTSELNSAFERAVNYLSLSPRSKKEIYGYLVDKGYDRDVADEAVKKLEAYHYVDDRLYAESYIKSKSKKYGLFRIVAELNKKGIPREIIDELTEDNSESDGATENARKYVRSHSACDKNKLKRFLASRGFSWDSISVAVSTLSDEGLFDGDFEE